MATPGAAREAIGMQVEVQLAAESAAAPPAGDLRRWAEGALQGDAGEVCLRLVGADEGAALNRRYRGGSGPTNVLSFPAEADLPSEKPLGDVVVCAPVVEAEARQQGKRIMDHYAHMVVHGVLHLRGFDHQTATAAAAMERLEAFILGQFGLADPYAP